MASSRGASSASLAARAPTNASPAPVVSTTSTLGADTCFAGSPFEKTAPSSPTVTTTDPGPRVKSSEAAERAPSTPSTLSPRREAASCSLSTRGSSFSSSLRGTSKGGARLTSARVPFSAAASTARRTTSGGISIWATSTRASPIGSEASSTSSAVRPRFAPGATVIAFSPSGVTVMKAVPVDEPETSCTRLVSTPLSASDRTSGPPNPSSPTRPRNATLAPRRAAAAAWLAPLPPLWVARRASVTVSPGAGRRCTLRTKSWLIEPTTKTSATLFSPEVLRAGGLPATRGQGPHDHGGNHERHRPDQPLQDSVGQIVPYTPAFGDLLPYKPGQRLAEPNGDRYGQQRQKPLLGLVAHSTPPCRRRRAAYPAHLSHPVESGDGDHVLRSNIGR